MSPRTAIFTTLAFSIYTTRLEGLVSQTEEDFSEKLGSHIGGDEFLSTQE
jgi:hypothetical protein